MCSLLLFLVVSFSAVSCREESGYSKLLKQDYPDLYTHIFTRNADSILVYTQHPKEHVRTQAWRALISTPVDDLDTFIDRVAEANIMEAWMALSVKELSKDQIDQLQERWDRQNSLREGISMVLGQQGDAGSLDFLVRNFENIIGAEYEYQAALAIGRLMRNHELSELNLRSVVRYAAVREDPALFRAYLYGIYRTNKVLQAEELQNTIWDTYEWSRVPQIRQYALAISMNSDADKTIRRLPKQEIAAMNTQVAVELARRTTGIEWGHDLGEILEALLVHQNPVVNTVALEQISLNESRPDAFDATILKQIVLNESKEASVRLSGLLALKDASGYQELARELASGNAYLKDKEMEILAKLVSPKEYVAKLMVWGQSEDHMELVFTAQALQRWWDGLSENDRRNLDRRQIKHLVYELLNKQDRSITYLSLNFMENSSLFGLSDFEQIRNLFEGYRLPEDIEVFQALGSFLKNTYEAKAQAWIDELAAQGNTTLNNTFREQGWEVQEMEAEAASFRTPDWDRLAELGFEPIWVLETVKGKIKIQMDAITAPATISGMDSLSRSGAYNHVAFHRVVPNFVIQGGDVESGDGFGGPDYVVPTEASAKEYTRGRVGIASAGTDTEGSQYFVMHDWAPHLNGRYTIVGEVIEGMDVVDRILVGDKVLQTYWEAEAPKK